jgi:glutamate synthase (NADPH/NADH) large chain
MMMKKAGLPSQQGLYNPQYEHDACGIGFVVNIKGKRSHDIIQQALTVLVNLTHRGGCGSEPNTGDGAGILMQIPHDFLKAACHKEGMVLPAPGQYAVGMVFLPQDPRQRADYEEQFGQIVQEEGQTLLGWRTVPVDDTSLGKTAKDSMPFIRQIFIGRNDDIQDTLTFERKLYIIRRRIENQLQNGLYVASLSSRTIVYKGMLTAEQVKGFYLDLADPAFASALALVHSRYSTNTFPSWERAHPYRYIIHNGEINTLRGNINWMHSRQSMIKREVFGEDLAKILPIINTDGSDSGMFDNCLEFLTLAGRSLPHAMMMMIPEPWSNNDFMTEEKKAFYEFHSCLMEPWDGPAAIGFTDGVRVGAVLDRNGLRPARYYVTADDMVVLASEVGVLDIAPERVLRKERLHPGRMLLIDTEEGRIISDDEIKHQVASEHPYRQWLDNHLLKLEELPEALPVPAPNFADLMQRQKAFGYTYEELRLILTPMAKDGVEPVGAMGNDAPLAVLSDKPQLLFNYFKQLFAQVTNPPIDALREEIVTSMVTMIGSEGDLVQPGPASCRLIKLMTPILTNGDLAKLRHIDQPGFKSATLPILFKKDEDGAGLQQAMNTLFTRADEAIASGANILILSDRDVNAQNVAIPSLLAVSGLHHYLIRESKRNQVSIILESGEPREVHHFALLLGFGASAVNPYLAFESIHELVAKGFIADLTPEKAVGQYVKAVAKGVLKVLSKMGISTIQSYQAAQIFEAVGIAPEVIAMYFTGTPSRVGGITLETIAKEAMMRHETAFPKHPLREETLESGGFYQWRKEGEAHLFNPATICKLQHACRTNNYELYQEYAALINEQTQRHYTLRGLLEFQTSKGPIPIDEVEPVEAICKRFKTGAMSYGSISQEAHETLAIAMNRIGGKSNTGEGGEDPARFTPMANGDSKCSAIKQVASGRFGVTSEYLLHAKEIQIKMAQGAKPGEGGQLPGRKVYPWIAKVRHSTPGVGLISPPPHHDIYSIEDLAELIHDLKNANPQARISVKLVSEVGVGTIAAGVAKGLADVILISGYDGGTGASPRTSIRHAGLPWELGLAETQQTLVLNNLRHRVVLETDGKLMTGRDVVIAALLGAEEYGFATAPLVVAGCVMMRICNLDTCPVGVATQNPKLRKKFPGDPEHVVNYMRFVAQEVREIMAELGFRTIDEMIGHTEVLTMSKAIRHWKASQLDLSAILYQPDVPKEIGRRALTLQEHGLEHTLDYTTLLDLCAPALMARQPVRAILPIHNTDRVVGTILGGEVTKRYGANGLPEDTIRLNFKGSAGQSFGAFIPKGVTLVLEGDANDYIGKGLSGGKIIVYPPTGSIFRPSENIIIGNVAFYGATSGEAYICGEAGERFAVRNSGVKAVVEGVGDHGCEYMTGGRVVILGKTGRNFAAGMSGGIAYVFDENHDFHTRCNRQMVNLVRLEEEQETCEVKKMIERHVEYTGSELGKRILSQWNRMVPKFVKVLPKDYSRMLDAFKKVREAGLSGEEATMAAFEENKRDLSRVSGN